eukprot:jgi/Psemu1/69105/estExt_Genemark1.C_7070020
MTTTTGSLEKRRRPCTTTATSTTTTSGERGSSESEGESEGESDSDDLVGARTGIHARILRLVAEKTNHKFRPLPTTHRVTILTHLCYYGYNFNPVSFYYVVDKKTEEIEAMVGEVSNTPWTEMYCYILHPDSTDQVATTTTTTTTTTNLKKAKTTKNSNEKETQTQPPQPPPSMNTNNSHSDSDSVQKVEYSFPKSFHVSPFMEMDYWYDWTFAGVPSQNKNRNRNSSIPLTVINTLRKRNNNRIEFTAKLVLDGNHSITPWTVVWELIKFPMLCVLLQIWIHYQAALLFLKGIVYVPHPQGSETAASVMIAKLMQDGLNTNTNTNENENENENEGPAQAEEMKAGWDGNQQIQKFTTNGGL